VHPYKIYKTKLATFFEEGESAITHFGGWKDILTAYTAVGGGLHVACILPVGQSLSRGWLCVRLLVK
jgi:hypothetical protein